MNITFDQAKIIAEITKNNLGTHSPSASEMFIIEDMVNSHCKYTEKNYGSISDTLLSERLSLGFAQSIEKISKRINWDGKEPAGFLCAIYDYTYASILCIAPSLLSPLGFGKAGKAAVENACKLAYNSKSFEDLPIEPSETKADQIMVDVKHMKKCDYGDYDGIDALMEKVFDGTASPRETAQLLCEYQTLFNRQKSKLFFRFIENKKRAKLLNKMEALLFEKYPETDLINTDPNAILGRITYKDTFKKLNQLTTTVYGRFLDYLSLENNVAEEVQDNTIPEEIFDLADEAADAVINETANEEFTADSLPTDEPLPTVDTQKIIAEASSAFMGAMSAMAEENSDFDSDDSDDEDETVEGDTADATEPEETLLQEEEEREMTEETQADETSNEAEPV